MICQTLAGHGSANCGQRCAPSDRLVVFAVVKHDAGNSWLLHLGIGGVEDQISLHKASHTLASVLMGASVSDGPTPTHADSGWPPRA